MLYPLPAVMVSVRGKNGEDNIITGAWAGTVCTNPPMVSISVRPERYSYQMIKESGAFVINLTTEDLCYATDYCGVRSGRDVDKFKEMKLTKVEAEEISAPMIGESPVNIECKVGAGCSNWARITCFLQKLWLSMRMRHTWMSAAASI